jgi:hypothetical protein
MDRCQMVADGFVASATARWAALLAATVATIAVGAAVTAAALYSATIRWRRRSSRRAEWVAIHVDDDRLTGEGPREDNRQR